LVRERINEMKAHARGQGEEKSEGDGKFKIGALVIPHWCFEVAME
jgi:hypothetical protein